MSTLSDKILLRCVGSIANARLTVNFVGIVFVSFVVCYRIPLSKRLM